MPSDLCREGIPDAEKAKEKIKKKFGICKPDDVAKVSIWFLFIPKIYLKTGWHGKGFHANQRFICKPDDIAKACHMIFGFPFLYTILPIVVFTIVSWWFSRLPEPRGTFARRSSTWSETVAISSWYCVLMIPYLDLYPEWILLYRLSSTCVYNCVQFRLDIVSLSWPLPLPRMKPCRLSSTWSETVATVQRWSSSLGRVSFCQSYFICFIFFIICNLFVNFQMVNINWSQYATDLKS